MKIRLVHLLTETDAEREIKSMESLSPLSAHGIEYIQHVNERYRGDAHLTHSPLYEGNHTPGHYGAFRSLRKAIEQEFDEDVDALIICECDCVLSVSHERFAELAQEAVGICREHLINYVSFGSHSANGILWSPVIEDHPAYGSFYLTEKIIMTHCILFPRHSREYLLRQLKTNTWDAADIWLNWSFRSTSELPPKRFAITREPAAMQHEGMSLLDEVWKEKQ
jgi:hypothetical protein